MHKVTSSYPSLTFLLLLKVFKSTQILFLPALKTVSVNRVFFKILVTEKSLRQLSLFLVLSSFFKYAQSIEYFAYTNVTLKKIIKVMVFFLTQPGIYFLSLTLTDPKAVTHSFDNFFFNYWWMERELKEMSGVKLLNKSDTRNLLLEYFSTITPLNKFFPPYGLNELFYSMVFGLVLHKQLSLQL
jgi:Ni,Fe-hydrogenase III component G